MSLYLKARKYGVAASVAVRERMAYGGGFLGAALTYGLFVFVFSRVWTSVYAGRSDIAGYGLGQIIWYFAVAEMPTFAFFGAFSSLSEDIKSGNVAYLVSRPYSYVVFSYAQLWGKALANCAVLIPEGLAIGLLTAGLPPIASACQALSALCAIILAGSAQFFLQLAIAMTAFWVEENAAFFWIFQKLSLIIGTLMPLEFLPETARAVAWWTPLPALAYVPARLFSIWKGGPDAALLLIYQAAWVALSALVCREVYAAARDRLSVNGG